MQQSLTSLEQILSPGTSVTGIVTWNMLFICLMSSPLSIPEMVVNLLKSVQFLDCIPVCSCSGQAGDQLTRF